jgi:hypothetical protein
VSHWSFKGSKFWAPAIKPGQRGTIKKDASKQLGGKRVVFAGTTKGCHWLRLDEDVNVPGCRMERGQLFVYLLKYVDWTE